MTAKKTDLYHRLEQKLEGQRLRAAVPGRFGETVSLPLDRRAQRKQDSAAGLVPFACKLPAELTAQLRERAGAHDGGINGLVAELIRSALKG